MDGRRKLFDAIMRRLETAGVEELRIVYAFIMWAVR